MRSFALSRTGRRLAGMSLLLVAVSAAAARVPRLLIDIPGVNWTGEFRESDWGEMLAGDRITVYVRHRGDRPEDWTVPEGVRAVTLEQTWDAGEAARVLGPVLEQAYAQGRDVHVVVDKNISLLRHTMGMGRPGTAEDRWAGAVTDYLAAAKPEGYAALLAEHSRGTVTNDHISDFSRFSYIVVSSPRGGLALSFLDRDDVTCPVDIITGVWDAPALRRVRGAGKLTEDHPNVRVLRLQDFGSPRTIHGALANTGHDGSWLVVGAGGRERYEGTLGRLLRCPGREPGEPAPEPTDETGGVDFSSVDIRYFAEPGDGSVAAVFSARRCEADSGIDLVEADRLTWNSLCTWLALPNRTFWVNLNPTEPDRIIDRELGRTDAGRIMLEADLMMKRDLAALTHPHDSELGREFWDGLYGFIIERQGASAVGRQIAVPVTYRVWVTPGRVRVHSTGDAVCIIEASLDVKLESDHLPTSGLPVGAVTVDRSATQDRAEGMLRSSILPALVELVNSSPRYHELRQVFHTRVIAEWYKTEFDAAEREFEGTVGLGSTYAWRMERDWSPVDVFRRYNRSLSEGEYSISEQRSDVWNGQPVLVSRSYFTGGVDFMNVRLEPAGSGSGGPGGSGGVPPGPREEDERGGGGGGGDSSGVRRWDGPSAADITGRVADALLLPTGYVGWDTVWVGDIYDAARLQEGFGTD